MTDIWTCTNCGRTTAGEDLVVQYATPPVKHPASAPHWGTDAAGQLLCPDCWAHPAWVAVTNRLPPWGCSCWVTDGAYTWWASRVASSAGGWSNEDTWADFEGRVTHWQPAPMPVPPHWRKGTP